LFVSTLDGSTITLQDVQASDSILVLKERIAARQG